MAIKYHLQNIDTGEVVEVTPKEARLGRMKKRLAAWSKSVGGLKLDMIHITLTYRGVDDWTSRDISRFMRRTRDFLGGKLKAYAWVAELQRRGAVHYHVLLLVELGVRIPKPDSGGWWRHGMTRIELIKGVGKIYGYIRKYVSKGDDGDFPMGLRLFAVVIRSLLGTRKLKLRILSLPGWLRDRTIKDEVMIKENSDIKKSGRTWIISGRQYKTPWRFKLVYCV